MFDEHEKNIRVMEQKGGVGEDEAMANKHEDLPGSIQIASTVQKQTSLLNTGIQGGNVRGQT